MASLGTGARSYFVRNSRMILGLRTASRLAARSSPSEVGLTIRIPSGVMVMFSWTCTLPLSVLGDGCPGEHFESAGCRRNFQRLRNRQRRRRLVAVVLTNCCCDPQRPFKRETWVRRLTTPSSVSPVLHFSFLPCRLRRESFEFMNS